MPAIEYELNPVEQITTGAIGPPGKRVFYLQGRSSEQLITLIVEKQQIQALAVGLEQFLDELHERLPDLSESEGINNPVQKKNIFGNNTLKDLKCSKNH